MTAEVTSGAEVGVALTRGCGDQGPYATTIAANRITEVDPRPTLATPVAADRIHLARDARVEDLPRAIRGLMADQG